MGWGVRLTLCGCARGQLRASNGAEAMERARRGTDSGELTRVLVVAWLVTGDSNLSADVHRTIIVLFCSSLVLTFDTTSPPSTAIHTPLPNSPRRPCPRTVLAPSGERGRRPAIFQRPSTRLFLLTRLET